MSVGSLCDLVCLVWHYRHFSRLRHCPV